MESYSYQYQSSSPVFNIIALVLLVVALAGAWKIFVKAGVPGWHSIIPILNTYDLCKIALKDSVGLFTKLAKAFGKGTGFGICTFLFSFVCYPILGFGDAEYLGPQ